MKTKQKSIRRCSPSSDLSLGVGKMAPSSETCKRKHSIFEEAPVNTFSGNITKKICTSQFNAAYRSQLQTEVGHCFVSRAVSIENSILSSPDIAPSPDKIPWVHNLPGPASHGQYFALHHIHYFSMVYFSIC